jgi:hypothetical protein
MLLQWAANCTREFLIQEVKFSAISLQLCRYQEEHGQGKDQGLHQTSAKEAQRRL